VWRPELEFKEGVYINDSCQKLMTGVLCGIVSAAEELSGFAASIAI